VRSTFPCLALSPDSKLRAFIYINLGIKLSVHFVPSQGNVNVSVELDGVEIDNFVIPGKDSPVCQLVNPWEKTLPSSSSNSHQVTFKYDSSGGAGLNSRASPVLELGEIR
jgi:hypothetical protein